MEQSEKVEQSKKVEKVEQSEKLEEVEQSEKVEEGLTGLQQLVQLLHAVGGAGLAVDALRVQPVHLHVLQHLLHDDGDGVLLADEPADVHPKVLGARLLIVLQQPQTQTGSLVCHAPQKYHHMLANFYDA